jgi:hypothetical protein
MPYPYYCTRPAYGYNVLKENPKEVLPLYKFTLVEEASDLLQAVWPKQGFKMEQLVTQEELGLLGPQLLKVMQWVEAKQRKLNKEAPIRGPAEGCTMAMRNPKQHSRQAGATVDREVLANFKVGGSRKGAYMSRRGIGYPMLLLGTCTKRVVGKGGKVRMEKHPVYEYVHRIKLWCYLGPPPDPSWTARHVGPRCMAGSWCACVNVKHLAWGTASQQSLDRWHVIKRSVLRCRR